MANVPQMEREITGSVAFSLSEALAALQRFQPKRGKRQLKKKQIRLVTNGFGKPRAISKALKRVLTGKTATTAS
jgi:hypothetical protein